MVSLHSYPQALNSLQGYIRQENAAFFSETAAAMPPTHHEGVKQFLFIFTILQLNHVIRSGIIAFILLGTKFYAGIYRQENAAFISEGAVALPPTHHGGVKKYIFILAERRGRGKGRQFG